MNADQLYDEVITKLIGRIEPTGESHTDAERLENLKVHVLITERLIIDLKSVSENTRRREHSMQEAGKEAVYAIKCLKGTLSNDPI